QCHGGPRDVRPGVVGDGGVGPVPVDGGDRLGAVVAGDGVPGDRRAGQCAPAGQEHADVRPDPSAGAVDQVAGRDTVRGRRGPGGVAGDQGDAAVACGDGVPHDHQAVAAVGVDALPVDLVHAVAGDAAVGAGGVGG